MKRQAGALAQTPSDVRVSRGAVREEIDRLVTKLAGKSSGPGVAVDFFENGNGWVGVASAPRDASPPRRLRVYVEGAATRAEAERVLLAALRAMAVARGHASRPQQLEAPVVAVERAEVRS